MKNALAFRSAFSAFLRSRLGAAGVEFALLLPMAAFVLAVALESARLSIAYALIERAVEEGIHEAKLNRGAEAETLVKAALEKWRFGVFDPSDLKLTFTSSSSMIDLLAGANPGAGTGGDSVHLKVDARLGVLEKVLPEGNPMKGKVEIHFFYINAVAVEFAFVLPIILLIIWAFWQMSESYRLQWTLNRQTASLADMLINQPEQLNFGGGSESVTLPLEQQFPVLIASANEMLKNAISKDAAGIRTGLTVEYATGKITNDGVPVIYTFANGARCGGIPGTLPLVSLLGAGGGAGGQRGGRPGAGAPAPGGRTLPAGRGEAGRQGAGTVPE